MILAMTEVIATRELSLVRDDGTSQSVQIKPSKPSQLPDSSDYLLPSKS